MASAKWRHIIVLFLRGEVNRNEVTVSWTAKHWTQDYCFQSQNDPQERAGAFCESKQRAYILSLSISELEMTAQRESNVLSVAPVLIAIYYKSLWNAGDGSTPVTEAKSKREVLRDLRSVPAAGGSKMVWVPSFSFLVNRCLKCLSI